MQSYIAILFQENGSAYSLSFPDLPGCFAASDTWEGIIAAATDALDLWFEDKPDVNASSLEELRERSDVLEATKEGASLVAFPYIPSDAATVRANISIERGLLNAIDETAKARGVSRSGFIASAVRREIVR